MLALRTACNENHADPRLWTLYAAQCVRLERHEDAVFALRQALWLRKRSHDDPRVRVTTTLLERLVLSGGLAAGAAPRAA